MAIRFAYGSYVSTSCAVRPTGRTIVPRMINDFAVSCIWTLQLEVELTEANTSSIVAKSLALRQAIAVQGLSGGIQFNDGTVRDWQYTVKDRRRKWKYPILQGRYNLRDDDNRIITETEKTPQQLATVILTAMGENPCCQRTPGEPQLKLSG